MPLKPPGTGTRWRDYRIDTPTFELSPVEKPDMSPYLVHMTGHDAIKKILEGANSPVALEENVGFLMAAVPDYEGLPPIFSRPVVCFSESPLFALDFFRYRSFRRWNDDQRFGIGFNKAKLVQRGVRPVLYLDGRIRSSLRALHGVANARQWQVSDDAALNAALKNLVEGLTPLVFPLLEDLDFQGFMWEREWRATFPEGFPFAFEDIELICCPVDEEPGIRATLGQHADNMRFVRTWLEYDDVTSFLQQRDELRRPYDSVAKLSSSIDEKIAVLDQQRALHEVAIHSLEGFVALSEQIATKADLARRELDALVHRKTHIERELAHFRAEKAKETSNKDNANRPKRPT